MAVRSRYIARSRNESKQLKMSALNNRDTQAADKAYIRAMRPARSSSRRAADGYGRPAWAGRSMLSRSSLRELRFNLVNTLRRCHSTVRALMNN